MASKEKDKAQKAASVFGGAIGSAVAAIRKRQAELDKAAKN